MATGFLLLARPTARAAPPAPIWRGEHGVASVAPLGPQALKVVLRLPKLGLLPGIIARLRRLFDLAADPEPAN